MSHQADNRSISVRSIVHQVRLACTRLRKRFEPRLEVGKVVR